MKPDPRVKIELDVLGPPRLRVEGGDPPPELLWRKHLALLVYLARIPRPCTRDHLKGLLWPEKDESKARHSLNEALRVIRRSVGEALRTEGENVELSPDVLRVDVDSLESVANVGAFLDGFTVPDAPSFEHWMVAEREALRVEVLDRLVLLAERRLSEGRLKSARSFASKALGVEPLHEPAVRVLMSALALGGGRALALKAYRRFEETLDSELEIAPSEVTADLVERIKSERLVPGASASREDADDVVPVIGQGRNVLSSCLEAWNASRSGVPTMVVLRGDSGTGKTRIADEVAARARLDGGVVAFARASVGETVEGICAALLKGGLAASELAGAAPQVVAALGELEPDLLVRYPAARDCQPAPPAADPFGQAVIAVAEARPVMLLIDDGFNADRAALEALGAIVQRASGVPVCVMLTVSKVPHEWGDMLYKALGRDIPGRVVETGFFGQADIEELVAWAFPDYDENVAGRLSRRVLADTAGNPFLVVEMVRAVRAGLRIREDSSGGAWPETARTLEQTMPGDLPQSVAASFRIRFQSLSDAAQALVSVVAVLGGGESLETMARAGSVTVATAERALDELEWQRWLVADARGYQFVTKLARDVVIADMVTRGKERRIRERALKY